MVCFFVHILYLMTLCFRALYRPDLIKKTKEQRFFFDMSRKSSTFANENENFVRKR